MPERIQHVRPLIIPFENGYERMMNTIRLQSIVFIPYEVFMLTTLHSNVLANYAAVLAPETHLLSFVSLSPETTYFLVCYQTGSQKSRSSTALMWRPHDVLELLEYVSSNAEGRINQFSALTYTCTEAGSRLEYQNIKEFWVSREPEQRNFIFSYVTDDGVSHIGHGATPSDGLFESLLRVY